MLSYLILLYLSWNATHAAPLSLLSRESLDVIPPSDASTCSCPNQRSVWDILWSCLATIFACSWVSVHPNIPGPDESRIKVAFRRLKLMFWAIVTPEMVIWWAIRQWVGARKLAQKWERQGWTKTHGYFIQMGGFMLYEGKVAKGVLSPERLEEFAGKGKIEFPIITEKEIKDRSKADALSKTLVIGQTTWFMLQCIARAIQGLEITQLELLTVALAFLNAFMYFFWWNKPLDAQTPVSVYLLEVTPLAASEDSDEAANPLLPTSKSTSRPSVDTWAQRLWTVSRDTTGHVISCVSSIIPSIQELVEFHEGYAGAIYAILVEGPISIAAWALAPLGDMFGGSDRSQQIDEGQMRVSTFYALMPDGDDETDVFLPVSAIAIAFGAIHCAGWALAFPSTAEAWIWRISSIAISATPLMLLLVLLFAIWNDMAEEGSLMKKALDVLGRPLTYSGFAMLPVYILARILLLVEAFITLRALTPSSLAVVKWTSFLPHI